MASFGKSSPNYSAKSSNSSESSSKIRNMSQSVYNYRSQQPWSRYSARNTQPKNKATDQKVAFREEKLRKIQQMHDLEMEKRRTQLREAEEREERMRKVKEADLQEKTRKLKEKELQRQQIVQDRRKIMEAQNEEKRKKLLEKYRAQSENRGKDQKQKPTYAFGSSTPRILAYLQNLDADQQVYDKKLKSDPLTAAELAKLTSPNQSATMSNAGKFRVEHGSTTSSAGSTPTRGRTQARRSTPISDRMTQSMHISPSKQRQQSSHPRLLVEHKKENLMTKSFTTSSGNAAAGRGARPPKAPVPRGPPPSTTRTRPIAQRRTVSAAQTEREMKPTTSARSNITPRDPSAPSRLTQGTSASNSRKMEQPTLTGKPTASITPTVITKRVTNNVQNQVQASKKEASKSPREKTTAGLSPPGTPPDEKRARNSGEQGHKSPVQKMETECGTQSESANITEQSQADIPELHVSELRISDEIIMTSPTHEASASATINHTQSEVGSSDVIVTEAHENGAKPVLEILAPPTEIKTRSSTVDSTDFVGNQSALGNSPSGSESSLNSNKSSDDKMNVSRVETVPTPKGIGQVTEQTEDAAKAALAEKRRIAREILDKEEQIKREAEETERIAEEERVAEEEEEFRRQEVEMQRLYELHKEEEQNQMQLAMAEKKRRDEEEKIKREEEEKMREENERVEKEKIDKENKDKDDKMRKEQEEREERKRRLEAVKARIGKSPGANASPNPAAQPTITAVSPVRDNLATQNGNGNVTTPSVVSMTTTLQPSSSSVVLARLANQSPVIGQLLSRHKSNPNLNDDVTDNTNHHTVDQNKNHAQDRLAQSMIQWPSDETNNSGFNDPFQTSHNIESTTHNNSRTNGDPWRPNNLDGSSGVLDDFDPFQVSFGDSHNNNNNAVVNGSNDLLNL